ncbi:MAG: DinB family protein [Chloroflexota bacterium]|nr:DinB family protein [Chloroflexota bacterium]
MNPSSGTAYAERLRAAAAPLLERARQVPPDRLYAAPDAETWSVMKILAHVAEFVPYWAREALKVATAADGAAFGRTHEDPARIAAVADHATDTLARATDRVQAALADAVADLKKIPDGTWDRRGHHSRRGEMTVAGILETFMLGHLEEHRQQLEETRPAAEST